MYDKYGDDTIRELFMKADEDKEIQAFLDAYIRHEKLRLRLEWKRQGCPPREMCHPSERLAKK